MLLLPIRRERGRKVRTPKGRMVANSDSEQSEESATEKKPLLLTGLTIGKSKGEKVR